MDVIVRCTLRDRRLARGLTLRQLEVMSGIHRGTISKYERNMDVMPIDKDVLFALLLGCKLDDLYSYEMVAGKV